MYNNCFLLQAEIDFVYFNHFMIKRCINIYKNVPCDANVCSRNFRKFSKVNILLCRQSSTKRFPLPCKKYAHLQNRQSEMTLPTNLTLCWCTVSRGIKLQLLT